MFFISKFHLESPNFSYLGTMKLKVPHYASLLSLGAAYVICFCFVRCLSQMYLQNRHYQVKEYKRSFNKKKSLFLYFLKFCKTFFATRKFSLPRLWSCQQRFKKGRAELTTFSDPKQGIFHLLPHFSCFYDQYHSAFPKWCFSIPP